MKKKKYSSVSEFAKEKYKYCIQEVNRKKFLGFMRTMLLLGIVSSENSFLKKLKKGYVFSFNSGDRYSFNFYLSKMEGDLAIWELFISIRNDCTYSICCPTINQYTKEVMKEMEKLVIDLIEYWKNEYGKKENSSNGQ